MSTNHVADLRSRPDEWHRRGLRHPDEIDALVHTRIHGSIPPEPSYDDFFRRH